MAIIRGVVLLGVLAILSIVSAHGTLESCEADRVYERPMMKPPNPDGVGWWSDVEGAGENEFVAGDEYNYTHSDIICHKVAQPGGLHAKVAAGEQVKINWYGWPPNHRGPMLDYMANCGGPCDKVQKEDLRWFKIAEMGMISPSDAEHEFGVWATDRFFETAQEVIPQDISPPDKVYGQKTSWVVTVPKDIRKGFYVLRTEIIALFAAPGVGGVQHYPKCINLEVTDGGDQDPVGVPGTSLYSIDEPGLRVRTYDKPRNYTIPGPPLYTGGSGGSQVNGLTGLMPNSTSPSNATTTSASFSSPSSTSSSSTTTTIWTSGDYDFPSAPPQESDRASRTTASSAAAETTASAEARHGDCQEPFTTTVVSEVTVTETASFSSMAASSSSSTGTGSGTGNRRKHHRYRR